MKFNFSLILFLFFSTTLLAQKKRNNEFGVTIGKGNYEFYNFTPYNKIFNDKFSYSTLFFTKKNKVLLRYFTINPPIKLKQLYLPEIYFNKKIYKNFWGHFAAQFYTLEAKSYDKTYSYFASFIDYYQKSNMLKTEFGLQYYFINKKKINLYAASNYLRLAENSNNKYTYETDNPYGIKSSEYKNNFTFHFVNLKTGFVLNPYKYYSLRFEITNEDLLGNFDYLNFSARI
jgi:hypothetical protein